MKSAALGFRAHSGWAVFVALSLDNGEPVVMCRERVHLVETFDFKFRQPYHTAKKLPITQGRAFITQITRESRRLAYSALRKVKLQLEKNGYSLIACGLLLASGKTLPGLEKILASHALIHAADGELFRNALAHASAKCGAAVFRIREKELLPFAAQRLHCATDVLQQKISGIGRSLGSPWSQGEKFAALCAWCALHSAG